MHRSALCTGQNRTCPPSDHRPVIFVAVWQVRNTVGVGSERNLIQRVRMSAGVRNRVGLGRVQTDLARLQQIDAESIRPHVVEEQVETRFSTGRCRLRRTFAYARDWDSWLLSRAGLR